MVVIINVQTLIMNSSHQHLFAVSISSSSEIKVVIYELFKCLFDCVDSFYVFHNKHTFMYESIVV